MGHLFVGGHLAILSRYPLHMTPGISPRALRGPRGKLEPGRSKTKTISDWTSPSGAIFDHELRLAIS